MKKRFLLLVFIFSQLNSIYSQEKPEKCVGLFCSENTLDIQLELYVDSLLAGGVSEKVKYPSILKFFSDNKIVDTFHIELSKRGHFRKFPNICDFPPLRIHFDNQETSGTAFEGHNKVKIVTHCQNNDSAFEQYVIQEYLIYKAYNLLTEKSFKTRLARIRYVDLSKTFPDVINYTFFIENPNDLAARLNGSSLDVKYIYPQHLDQYQYALMCLFQFMMINQDWSVSLLHNVEIIATDPGFKMTPIPFDFDMCGIIAIPYKSPTVPFKKGVKPERNYMGKNISKEHLLAAIDTLKANKNLIIKNFNTSPLLTPVNRKNIVNHLTEFYDNISDFDYISKVMLGGD